MTNRERRAERVLGILKTLKACDRGMRWAREQKCESLRELWERAAKQKRTMNMAWLLSAVAHHQAHSRAQPVLLTTNELLELFLKCWQLYPCYAWIAEYAKEAGFMADLKIYLRNPNPATAQQVLDGCHEMSGQGWSLLAGRVIVLARDGVQRHWYLAEYLVNPNDQNAAATLLKIVPGEWLDYWETHIPARRT